MTGMVVDAPDPRYSPAGDMTIRDPYTESDTVVTVAFGLGAGDVGDSATGVVLRSNRSRAATPATLKTYLVLWLTLPLAALAWPILWRRRWGIGGRTPRGRRSQALVLDASAPPR